MAIGAVEISLIGVLIALIAGVIARDRQVFEAIRKGDDDLHARISKVRDEYVRRDDLNGHLDRVERAIAVVGSQVRESQNELRDELRATNVRIDAVLTQVKQQPRSPSR